MPNLKFNMDKALELKTDIHGETIWLTQQQTAQLFDVKKAAISKHIKNIFDSEELTRNSTVSKMETVQKEGAPMYLISIFFCIRTHPK